MVTPGARLRSRAGPDVALSCRAARRSGWRSSSTWASRRCAQLGAQKLDGCCSGMSSHTTHSSTKLLDTSMILSSVSDQASETIRIKSSDSGSSKDNVMSNNSNDVITYNAGVLGAAQSCENDRQTPGAASSSSCSTTSNVISSMAATGACKGKKKSKTSASNMASWSQSMRRIPR